MERPLPATMQRLEGMRSDKAEVKVDSPKHKKTPSPPPARGKLSLSSGEMTVPNHSNILNQFEFSDVPLADTSMRYAAALRSKPDKRSFVGPDWDQSTTVSGTFAVSDTHLIPDIPCLNSYSLMVPCACLPTHRWALNHWRIRRLPSSLA